jgi:hypothetical protein
MKRWLVSIEVGNYADNWQTASGYFKGAVNQEQMNKPLKEGS